MTVAERLAETFELSDFAWDLLDRLSADERARRLEVAERRHRESSEALLKGLARS